MKYNHLLHIFRRDLRLIDNTALIHAASLARLVSLGFIFDPRQVKAGPYHSDFAFKFMLESLEDLAAVVKKRGGVLNFCYGLPDKVLAEVLEKNRIDCVTVNADYTPFSNTRDTALRKVCEKRNVDFLPFHDSLINEPGTVLTGAGTPFKVFTAFYSAARKIPVQKVREAGELPLSSAALAGAQRSVPKEIKKPRVAHAAVSGGRHEGMQLLKHARALNDYEARRDFPADEHGTTTLSAHLKFGTLSVREAYQAAPLRRSLYWRDFFVHVASAAPRIWGHAYLSPYDRLEWDNDEKKFAAWCEGRTGFPIVDAGMRQLNQTGFMHNRVRMIVASFLVKDLHIDWRWGERYFAEQLVDYDPAVNNGNWQWVASTGCDAQPYFRIFNPWLQQKKFDPEARYIKRWVPVLAAFPAGLIHSLYKNQIAGYQVPLIDHAVESKEALRRYKKVA